MKHKHYDKIVAKAANVELVVFLENNQGWSEKENQSDIQFHEQFDYFLCLPQHKEAVLNCLNGGESQVASISSGWLPANCGDPVEWGGEWWYMNPNGESRIKPKKEKRWIAIKKGNKEVGRYTCETLEEAKDMYIPRWWSHHEVEIEVEV